MDSTNFELSFQAFQLTFTTAAIEISHLFGQTLDPESIKPEGPPVRSRAVCYVVIDGQARVVVQQSPPDAVVPTGALSVLEAV